MRHLSPGHFDADAAREIPARSATSVAGDGSTRRPPSRSRLVLWLVLCGILPIAAIVLSTATLVSNFRDRALANGERELKNTALILAEQADRAFQALELVEAGVAERVQSMRIASSQEFERRMSGLDVHLMLKDKISGLPLVDGLSLINADGKLFNFSRHWPPTAIDVGDREYFKRFKSDANSTSRVTEPLHNRNTGAWSIFFGRRLTAPTGEFLGVVLAAVETRSFEKFFGGIVLGKRSSISLFRENGVLLVRSPGDDSAVGQVRAEIFDALLGADSGVVRSPGRAGTEDRLLAVRRSIHYPLIVAVEDDVAEILADWRQQTHLLLGAGALAALTVGVVIFLIAYRLMRRANRSRQDARAAHARLRDAFEVVPEGLALFDAEDRFVLWNRRYKELYAQSADDIRVGVRFEDVLRAGLARGQYPDATGRETAWLAERLAVHGSEQSDHEQQLPGDRWIRVQERRTADGGTIGVRIDITELKLREASFRLLFESNPLPMYVFDLEDLRFVTVNDAAVIHYGYSREQFLTMTVLDIRPAQDRERFVAELRSFDDYRTGAPSRHQKRDGTVAEVEIYSKVLTYQGRPARFAAVVDVTERRRAETDRDRSRAFLDQIIDNVPASIIVKEARERRYVLVNRAAEELWALARGATIGKTAFDLFAKEPADLITADDDDALRSDGPVYLGDHRNLGRGDSSRIITSKKIAIRDTDRKPLYVISVIEDVTDRRAVEQQLQQAQKMEAVGNLTGGLAHDFNNLLTIIIGNLDLLKGDVAGNEDAELKVETILQASVRGADLTRQMLAFSRRQPLHPTCVDVSRLVYDTTRMLTRTLGESVRIDLRVAADTWPVLVDQAQLEAALVNIAINARDAMPGGGTLAIATAKLHLDADRPVVVGAVAPGDYMVIAMSDTGGGMPPEIVARVFEPFFTTKSPGHGTGLGLSMVYGFVNQSGGQVGVDSEVGKGTTFTLYLPRAAGPELETSTRQSVERRLTPLANGEVVLAVDDNHSVRATVVMQLEGLGYRVLEADSGTAALEILDGREEIDLLFTDIVMPGGLNGKELATKARALRPDLKVLFTSGFPGAERSAATELDDGDVLLSKPYRRYDLAKAVHDVLAG